jgi:hypothetical protein
VENAAASIKNPTIWIGDGACDAKVNTAEFGYDGGDCCRSTCVPSLFECRAGSFDCKDPAGLKQDSCFVKRQKNGKCNAGIRNTLQCGYDAGDCCEDTCTGDRCLEPEIHGGWPHCKDPASARLECCHVKNLTKLGDGVCDPAPYNSLECNYDGGDCCPGSCHGDACVQESSFDCKNPTYLSLGECEVENQQFLGDGWCDGTNK